jgi:hypothetical protein
MIRPAVFLLASFAVVFGAVALRVASAPVARAGTPAAIATTPATQQAEHQRENEVKRPEPAKASMNDRKSESKLTLQAARPGGASGRGQRTVSYPLEFRAGDGETVGAIRALVTTPGAGWKFVKAEFAPGSRLKVSIQQEKKNRDQAKNGGETIEMNITAGAHVIRDGIIGELQFSVPAASSSEPPATPVVKVLATSPPQTEQVREPTEAPFELPPSAPANPGVSCFFFSH